MIRWPKMPGSHPLRLPIVLAVVSLASLGWGLARGDTAFAALGAAGAVWALVAVIGTFLAKEPPGDDGPGPGTHAPGDDGDGDDDGDSGDGGDTRG